VTPWKLPFIVAAIVAPIAIAFLSGGPAVGVAVGAFVAVAIVIFAVRQRPRDTIGVSGDDVNVQRLLVVVGDPLEDARAIEEIRVRIGGDEPTEVMVLAPASIGFLDRWASDVEGARRDAQQRLVISVASLAAAGIEAEARVGDEDVVQAVEDRLGSFPATDVIFVSAGGEEDKAAAAVAAELRTRLQADFHWVVTGPAAR
jgi:hypothetical protein